MSGIILPPFIGTPEEAPTSSSGLLVYDEIWVREPRLMVPRMTPVGRVTINPRLFNNVVALFPSQRGITREFISAAAFSNNSASNVLAVSAKGKVASFGSAWDMNCTFGNHGAPGTGDVFMLCHAELNAGTGYRYIGAYSAETSLTFGMFASHPDVSEKWGCALGGLSGASVLGTGEHVLCAARLGGVLYLIRNGIVEYSASKTTDLSGERTALIVNSYSQITDAGAGGKHYLFIAGRPRNMSVAQAVCISLDPYGELFVPA